MGLQNYTSQISASRSISMIENKLAASGASQILKEYGPKGNVFAIAFIKKIDGRDVPFRLPVNVAACETILKANIKRPRSDTMKRITAQAERTAWKIIYDWVCCQMTMLELKQAEYMQLFLPYMYDHAKRETYYDKVMAGGLKKLLPAAE